MPDNAQLPEISADELNESMAILRAAGIKEPTAEDWAMAWRVLHALRLLAFEQRRAAGGSLH